MFDTHGTPDPIPLDSENAGYRDKMRYPCVADRATDRCEYKTANVEVDIGLFTDGRLAHGRVDRLRGSAALVQMAALDALLAIGCHIERLEPLYVEGHRPRPMTHVLGNPE